jgi:sugar O-acyltransferase (sialic acid O-acetyltransferase NeuD family)
MVKEKKLVIFGDSAFAEIAYEYFTHDSEYEVVAFTVTSEFLNKDSLFGLPVVAFEDVEKNYDPAKHNMYIALVYNNLNRTRMKFYFEAKAKGYKLSSYVSSRAFVWHNVEMGDNCFVFEDNTIQPFVKMGSNLVLWSGNHIGHHSVIESHSFISSHVVISGFCVIRESCFFGVNSTIGNNVTVGKDSFLGAGALITKTIPDGSYIKGNFSEVDKKNTYIKFNIK